jgi:hypothetical protein
MFKPYRTLLMVNDKEQQTKQHFIGNNKHRLRCSLMEIPLEVRLSHKLIQLLLIDRSDRNLTQDNLQSADSKELVSLPDSIEIQANSKES